MATATVTATDTQARHAKEQVVDKIPARIKHIQFGIYSNPDVVNQAVLEVSDRNVYDLTTTNENARVLTENGPMDTRMGISTKVGKCTTCGEGLNECNGHFGHIKLALPAFHVGYLKHIIEVLNCICKDCSRVLLDVPERRKHLRTMRRPGMDNLQRTAHAKKIMEECRKRKNCPYCGALNGTVRKVPGHPLKVIHNRYDAFLRSTARTKKTPLGRQEFEQSFETAKAANNEVDKNFKKAVDDMHPLRTLNLFKKISPEDCELLAMIPEDARPEMLIWEYMPVPPVAIRPSVMQEAGATEDDITNKIGDICHISSIIRAGLARGFPLQILMEQWDFLQLQIAMYINSETPGLKQQGLQKTMRGFCQRLKGKGGRFRQNLSGKRVDFSGRTVIGPDPNLAIDEVAVPQRVAKNLTYPEKVTKYNMDKMKKVVKLGPYVHPGANNIIKLNGRSMALSILARDTTGQKLIDAADRLQIGDIVERHLEDGDIVLFNRQPSLHRLSILSHRAKIRPWRTFRLNECACNPYNADFDGDEMNLHVPQTEEARTEATELMGVKYNLATPKNGTPLIAAIQDFITAAYQLSSKNNFFDRGTFTQICNYMFAGEGAFDPSTGRYHPIELPPPTVLKPQALWTGKQVWSVLMRPFKDYGGRDRPILVNLEARCKQFKANPGVADDLNEDDAFLVIRNSEVMCGCFDKATVGDGKKDSVFYVIMRDFGEDYAVQAMNRLAKVSARWLTNNGFSLGINDVTPGDKLNEKKQALIDKAYAECDVLIKQYKEGTIERMPGCDALTSMENKIGGILSGVRAAAGEVCFEELSRWNAPLLMAKCGSKGSNINVSQMVASVGQQMIGGARVADGFQHRTLPHFPKAARQPVSKGFVSNSFFSGLTPPEFIFHAMSGREGLVDTAVKTAETGYMSRRLMKSLEDLSKQYDNTVSNSSGTVVQFQYGADDLDPVDMEGKAAPVNFVRTFTHAVTITWNNAIPSLTPNAVRKWTEERLNKRRNLRDLRRMALDQVTELDFKDQSDLSLDDKDPERAFVDDVQNFVFKQADKLEKTLAFLGLPDPPNATSERSERDTTRYGLADGIAKISQQALETFIELCLTKYKKSKVQPGHAVGAIGAQSIGEPGTQMTLKTFHFAGVAGMSITQGVPRIKEIINASTAISTPVIACQLSNPEFENAARVVKARVEKTFLKDIVTYIEDIWHPDGSARINMGLCEETIKNLFLDLRDHDIISGINKHKPLKWGKAGAKVSIKNGKTVTIFIADPQFEKKPAAKSTKTVQKQYFERVQQVKTLVLDAVIKGYPDAQRAIIKKETSPNARNNYECQLLVEGYGLKDCLNTPGIEPYKTKSNHIMEVNQVLGIEAARATIAAEIGEVMGSMDIDPRHMALLADVMTFKGAVFGITRFGLQKTRDSVLQLASFEKTPDHLFEAAAKGKIDNIDGVSECIIMGQSVKLGTGAMEVYRPLEFKEGDIKAKPTMFETGWDAL
ncbi:DNA-directed RNA polymerase III subunit C1 (rpo31) [Didymosphaeria variabile]|uniref:DNA-directed RNA polymerase subunit n=1 Tax=Didymosphaeria variabile TaxID=1932322 RepID=A0A9W8XHC7_9PLEO|nr:DNA-directed RNA polymerase III subunit C1 (rpo31) [Didymosphaeria variabile]KAJ4350395.1 DNA-directed RNA polymerase III subunit C1 (rpo31) [Didymosphaeria variabile]